MVWKNKEQHTAKVGARDQDPTTTRKRYIRELNNIVPDYTKLKQENIIKYNIQYDKTEDLYYWLFLRGRPTGLFGFDCFCCTLLNFSSADDNLAPSLYIGLIGLLVLITDGNKLFNLSFAITPAFSSVFIHSY